MTLLELKERIDYILIDNPELGRTRVLITTADPSVGARNGVTLSNANMGFDWETGQFRLEPEVPLVRKIQRNRVSEN